MPAQRPGRSATRTLGVELVDDLLRDPAPVGDVLPRLLGPLPDGLVLLPVRGRTAATAGRTAADDDTTARNLGARAHVRREDVPQFRGVRLRQVDLVLNAVEGELDGL